MKKFLFLIAALFVASAAPLSAEAFEGYLVDKKCSASKNTAEAAKAHTKDCAVACKDSGFGIVTEEGKFIPFDADGDGMAANFLKAMPRKDNLKVQVVGDLKGDTLSGIKAIQMI